MEIKNFAEDTYSNDRYVWFYNGPFSNFYQCKIVENTIEYNCTEQYFMAKKALLFNDPVMYQKIIQSNNQKAYGRKVKNFVTETWNNECEKIMYNANLLKYTQNTDLKDILLATCNKEIAEASPYDTIWGVGLGPKNKDTLAV